MEEEKNYKIIFVGDGYVGKTSIVKALLKDKFDDSSDPNVINEKKFNYENLSLSLIDTAGQEEYDGIRRLAFEQVSLFVVCYALDDENSFFNVKSKWAREVDFYKDVPKILIGTKADLRAERRTNAKRLITISEGQKLQKKIKAAYFLECSSKTDDGIEKIPPVIKELLEKRDNKNSCILQ